jgi:hypothetical protein
MASPFEETLVFIRLLTFLTRVVCARKTLCYRCTVSRVSDASTYDLASSLVRFFTVGTFAAVLPTASASDLSALRSPLSNSFLIVFQAGSRSPSIESIV